MARGEDTRNHAGRRVGPPAPKTRPTTARKGRGPGFNPPLSNDPEYAELNQKYRDGLIPWGVTDDFHNYTNDPDY